MAVITDDRWSCPHCGLTVAIPGRSPREAVLRRMVRDTHRCTRLTPIPERTP